MFHFCFMDHVGHFEYYESLRKIAWAVGIVMASFIEISTNQYDGIGIFFTFRVMLPGLWSRVTAEPPLQYWGKAPFSGSKNGKTWYVQHASPLGVRFPACFFLSPILWVAVYWDCTPIYWWIDLKKWLQSQARTKWNQSELSFWRSVPIQSHDAENKCSSWQLPSTDSFDIRLGRSPRSVGAMTSVSSTAFMSSNRKCSQHCRNQSTTNHNLEKKKGIVNSPKSHQTSHPRCVVVYEAAHRS